MDKENFISSKSKPVTAKALNKRDNKNNQRNLIANLSQDFQHPAPFFEELIFRMEVNGQHCCGCHMSAIANLTQQAELDFVAL